jgi:hypothetical protein
MSPEDRQAVTSAGGRARVEALTPDERAELGRAGAAAVNSAAGLARRIVKAWPELTRAERAEVRAILAPLAERPRTRPIGAP